MLTVFDESVTFHSALSIDRYSRKLYRLHDYSVRHLITTRVADDSLLTANDVVLFQFARPAKDTCNVGNKQGTCCAERRVSSTLWDF